MNRFLRILFHVRSSFGYSFIYSVLLLAQPADANEFEMTLAELSKEEVSSLIETLNKASKEELHLLKGVETVRAKAIINARPFKRLDELMLLDGFGEKTVQKLVKTAVLRNNLATGRER